MPRSIQESLIHVLLLWLILLSITQVAFIIFFFTAGHHHPAKSDITGGPESALEPLGNYSAPLPLTDPTFLVKGQMFTYKAVEENGKIKWISRYGTNNLVEYEKGFKIKEAGFYFLNLQVTLKRCNQIRGSQPMVSLKCNNRELLLGWINNQTCSTGLLGKVEAFTGGATLEITEMASDNIDESEALTHLDIIMLQPKAML